MQWSGSESFASIGQCLAHHARRQPSFVALVHRSVPFSYRALAAQVVAVMDDLAVAGLRPGQVVGVEATDRHLHLLILLAAEALGLTTMSVTASELGPPAALDRLCDRILASHPVSGVPSERRLTMPERWLEQIVGRPVRERRFAELEAEPVPNALVRLIKSSGTTGAPKVMGMTHRVQQAVIGKTLFGMPAWLRAHPDYLCLYGFTVRAAHTRALLTLQCGGTIHLTAADALWAQISRGTGNYALFVSGDLERFVRSVPFGQAPPSLYLDVIGSAVPPQLHEQVRAKLTEHLVVSYSSNEVNRVSVVDADNVGTLFPDVRVRIVDERGAVLPIGQTGAIQVRSDTMTDGYIGALELTRTAFVDGWFVTGDVGFQPSTGTLVVLGRADAMLNVGGVKVAPGPIEARLKAIEGVADALVTSVDDVLQTRVLLVAVESDGSIDPTGLRAAVSAVVRAQVASFELLVLPALPRTETGKVRVAAVRALYRQRTQVL